MPHTTHTRSLRQVFVNLSNLASNEGKQRSGAGLMTVWQVICVWRAGCAGCRVPAAPLTCRCQCAAVGAVDPAAAADAHLVLGDPVPVE